MNQNLPLARVKTFLISKRLIFYAIVVAALSLCGAWILFYGTHLSPWGGSDSVEYLVSARNMLQGNGIGYFGADGNFYWATLHPPFYPMVVGAVSLTGLDLVEAARWINILLFAATIGLSGFLFWRTSHSPSLSILAGLLIVVFPEFLMEGAGIMSEPLFIFLCVLHSLFLIIHLRTKRIKWLLLAALTAGLAALARYIGIALIVSGAASLVLFSRERWSGRFKKSALYLFLACLPLAIWFGWLRFGVNLRVGGRTFGFDPGVLLQRLQSFRLAMVGTVWSWLPLNDSLSHVPYRGQLALLILFVLGAAALTLLAYRPFRRRSNLNEADGDLHLFGIFGLFSLFNIGFLMLSKVFSSPAPDINNRMLLPLYLSSVIALLAAFSIWGKRWLAGWWGGLKLVPWLLAALWLVQVAPQSTATISHQHDSKGLRMFENSPLIEAVRALPKDIPIITTRPNIILLWADRPAYYLKMKFSEEFLSQTGLYGSDLQDPLQTIFREGGAAFVDFNDLSPEFIQVFGTGSAPRLDQMVEGLVTYLHTPNGSIYFYPK